MSPRHGRAHGDLENEIIACLASSATPMTAGEVRVQLHDDLAYTTVMTTLARLHAKNALVRTARGRAFAYGLVDDADGAHASVTAHQMHRLLAGTDRTSVLTRFVQSLDDESEQVLRALLAGEDADS